MYCFEVKILQLKKTRIIAISVDFLYKHSQCLVLTLTMLVKKSRFLIILTVRSPQVQLGLWTNQKISFMKAAALIRAIGKPSLTPTQAKKLDSLGLSFAELTHLHQHSSTMEVFLAALKAKGIRSKVLREKLGKALGPLR